MEKGSILLVGIVKSSTGTASLRMGVPAKVALEMLSSAMEGLRVEVVAQELERRRAAESRIVEPARAPLVVTP